MSDKLDKVKKLADDVQAAPAFRKMEAGVRLFNELIIYLEFLELHVDRLQAALKLNADIACSQHERLKVLEEDPTPRGYEHGINSPGGING